MSQINRNETTMTSSPPLLFFDGVCGLCNQSVDFVIRHDKEEKFQFAPLQGETAKESLSEEEIAKLNSLVLKTEKGLYRRSAAVVRILWLLGGFWKLLGWLLWIIPLPLRDLGYRMVSASRYRVFGKKESCRIPSPEERKRFLD